MPSDQISDAVPESCGQSVDGPWGFAWQEPYRTLGCPPLDGAGGGGRRRR
jgi:hypothetical protein